MVHGQSLGGMSVSYVAMKEKKHPIDFVFIDRTFASIDSVVFWGAGVAIMTSSICDKTRTSISFCCMSRQFVTEKFGSLISSIFRLITGWKVDSAENYSKIEKSNTKYVLLGCDPVRDNVIPYLSTLQA